MDGMAMNGEVLDRNARTMEKESRRKSLPVIRMEQ